MCGGVITCVKGTCRVCLLSTFQELMMVSTTYLETDLVWERGKGPLHCSIVVPKTSISRFSSRPQNELQCKRCKSKHKLLLNLSGSSGIHQQNISGIWLQCSGRLLSAMQRHSAAGKDSVNIFEIYLRFSICLFAKKAIRTGVPTSPWLRLTEALHCPPSS